MKEQMMKENSVFVCTEGRLILEFGFDDLMRIKSWHFSTRHHQELISRSLIAMQQAQQDPGMMEQLTKNITRQGLTNSTLNYLRVSICFISEPNMMIISNAYFWFFAVVCHSWTNARADEQVQDISTQSTGLLKDDTFPKMATDGGPTGNIQASK